MTSSDELKKIQKMVEAEQGQRSTYITRRLTNYKKRFNIWDRPNKEDDPDAFPWQGASDQRIFMIDGQIRKAKAQKVNALFKGRMFFEPMNPAAAEKAKLAEDFWHWFFHMRINPRREVALAADILEEKGMCVLHVPWVQEKSCLYEAFNPNALPPEVVQAVQSGQIQLPEQILNIVRAIYPDETDENLIKAWEDYKAGVPLDEIKMKRVVHTKAQPAFIALAPDTDLIIPSYTADSLQEADWIIRVYRYSKSALQADQFSLDYKPEVVKAIIETMFDDNGVAKGSTHTAASNDSIRSSQKSQYGVASAQDGVLVYDFYQRYFDEDGVKKIKVVTYCPDYMDAALREIENLDYPHGEYPFIPLELEVIARNVHSSRGKPEILEHVQDELKIQTDSRIDRTTYQTLPAIVHPMAMPPSELGPGSQYGYSTNPNELGFLAMPPEDRTAQSVSMELRAQVQEYFGTLDSGAVSTGSIMPRSAEEMRQFSASNALLAEFDIENWMNGWQRAIQQAWALTQAYLPEEVWFRTIGNPNAPMLRIGVKDIQGQFNIIPVVSIQDLLPQKGAENAQQILQAALTDQTGTLDKYEAMMLWLTRIDVKAARRVLLPKDTATKNEVEAELDVLTRISAGIPQQVPPSANFQLRLQMVQQYTQQPDVAQRLQQDKAFAQRMDVHIKQLQFMIQQMQNAQIGRTGYNQNTGPTTPALPAGLPQ